MSKSFLPFKDQRQILVVHQVPNGQLTEALIGVVQSGRALSYFLDNSLRVGEGLGEELCAGIYMLFERQNDILAGITNAVQVWEDELRAEEDAEAAAVKRGDAAVTKARESFIAESMRAGMEPQVVAQALNMRRASVDRVIAQLRGEPAAAQAATA